MILTMKQVLDGLGLMPFEEYVVCPKRLAWVKKMRDHNPLGQSVDLRGRGKTTHMICYLLVSLSKIDDGSKVYVNGHDHPYTRQLCYQAREYAERLGLDPMQIMPIFGKLEDRDFQRRTIFQDHYVNLRRF